MSEKSVPRQTWLVKLPESVAQSWFGTFRARSGAAALKAPEAGTRLGTITVDNSALARWDSLRKKEGRETAEAKLGKRPRSTLKLSARTQDGELGLELKYCELPLWRPSMHPVSDGETATQPKERVRPPLVFDEVMTQEKPLRSELHIRGIVPHVCESIVENTPANLAVQQRKIRRVMKRQHAKLMEVSEYSTLRRNEDESREDALRRGKQLDALFADKKGRKRATTKKQKTIKAARIPDDVAKSRLFNAFDKSAHYRLQELKGMLHAPLSQVREVLKLYCEKVLHGGHRGMYRLKSTYVRVDDAARLAEADRIARGLRKDEAAQMKQEPSSDVKRER
ncbi:MAG: hypothetical protein MHM6MM_002249 [Cercozoa sp. M6MM]